MTDDIQSRLRVAEHDVILQASQIADLRYRCKRMAAAIHDLTAKLAEHPCPLCNYPKGHRETCPVNVALAIARSNE